MTSKSPPILFKLLNPWNDFKSRDSEEEASTLKLPPIVSRFCNPSKDVMRPLVIIRLSVIVFKPYKPSKEVRVEHSNLSEPLISVSRLPNFCKVLIPFPFTIILPMILVCPAAWKSIKSCSVSKTISPAYIPFAA